MDYKRLSKTIARALRHDPAAYGVELDDEGWTPVETLLAALRPRRREWRGLSEDDLHILIAQSEKKRYEIQDGKVRAYYGHSLPDKIQKEPAEPPAVLYHGTAPRTAEIILREGLRAMNRQYVHLSADRATAATVGARHASTPVILEIRAAEAHRAGVQFYPGNEDVWLADAVPAEFILDPASKMQ
ncbi:MAG: RNA 2'-phosphotransferase [Planctomycetaceae bacterium]|nr:MAG: RNA 2'-phosphotransferase [Planctomycetaceae bacterium]